MNRALKPSSCFMKLVCGFIMLLLSMTVATRVQGPLGWTISAVDGGSGNQGAGAPISLALDHLGRPHVAYGKVSGLIYASWSGSDWQYETVDTSSWLAYPISLKLDRNDSPSVAYSDDLNKDLRYAHRENGTWIAETVDSYGDVGYWTSLAIDSSGRPHIAYQNVSSFGASFTIKYAMEEKGIWTFDNVCEVFGSYRYGLTGLSLALNSTEVPRIAFTGVDGLDYAYLEGASWRIETVQAVSGQTGDAPSMVLDSTGMPHISFSRISPSERLEYAKRGPLGWASETIELERGSYSSIAVDNEDNLHVGYTAPRSGGIPGYLYYAKSYGLGWTLETVDPQEFFFDPPSVAIDGCDGIHIAYWHYSPGVDSWVRYAFRPGQDISPPSSVVSTPGAYWHNSSPMNIHSESSDSCSGIANITLAYRHSSDKSIWGSWTQYSTLASPPWSWSFTFPEGEGYYEFYSTAHDNMGNAESPPLIADAIAAYDITPPVSAAVPVSQYWYTSPQLTVNATAMDNFSGVANVTLLYSYAPLDNSSWSTWTAFGMRISSPWSWSFHFPDGKGNYRFHTKAIDVAGNVEGAKTIAEAVAGYDMTPPVTMPDYSPINEQPISPTKVGLSSSISLSLAVHNGGNATGAADTVLAFYNSTTPATPFRTFTVNSIVPGGNSSSFTAIWTSPATPGIYLVSVDVDYFDNVSEWDETNNVYTWTIEVVAGPITSLVIGNPNYTSTATYVKSVTPLGFSVVDQSGLGIRNTTYTVDGGTPVNYTATGTFFLAGEGVHKIEWQSLDWAGNLEDIGSMNLTVDDTPPTTTIIPATIFTLTATDSGCGVNVTMYRIDGGQWTVYKDGFTVPEGAHNISYYSVDNLDNTEQERWFVVKPPPEVAVNYKPIIALMFAVILAVVGIWASKKKPWKGGKDRMAVAKTFAITSMPFVLAEAGTGVVSLLTGLLSIPPLLGVGTAIDLAILTAGLAVSLYRALGKGFGQPAILPAAENR